MANWKRALGRGCSLLAITAVGYGAWYLGTHPHWGSPPTNKAEPDATLRAERVTVFGWQRRNGRPEKVWQVTASDVRQAAGGQMQWFKRITEGILLQDGRPVARFTAGRGQGDQAANLFSIQGGARLRLEKDGTTLATEQVEWRGAQRQLWLPRPVQITRGTMRLDVGRARLDLLPGQVSVEGVTCTDRGLGFKAAHGVLLLKERRLELRPASVQMPAGHAQARRVVYFAEKGRFTAQEVRMKLAISSVARVAAAASLSVALVNASHAAPAKEKQTRTIDVFGDTLTDSASELIMVNATFVDRDRKGENDTKVRADKMVFEKDEGGKTKRIIATGKPRAWNERNDVTGEKMIVFPGKRLVVVEGNFRVVVKPKPGEEPSSDKRDLRGQVRDGSMTGDRLEYDYRNKNMMARGNLKLESRGRTATGEKMTYTEKTEMVEFTGTTHFRDEKGQTLVTPVGVQIALNKSGKSRILGPFKGTFFVEEEEEEATPEESTQTAQAPKPAEGSKEPATPAKPGAGKE